MFGLRRIDRYVLQELVGPTVLAFTMYTFILLMNSFFIVAQRSIAKNLTWELTFRLFLLNIPELLIYSIPMSVLLGCLIGIGRLSYDSEWVAIQGSGHGTRILIKPALALGIIATALSMYTYWFVVPESHFAKRRSGVELFMASNMASDLKPRTFFTMFEGIVLMVDDIVPGNLDGRLDGVFIRRSESKSGPQEIYLARSGNLYPSPDGRGDLEVDLNDCFLYRYYPQKPESYQSGRFDTYHLPFPAPSYFRTMNREPNKTVRDRNFVELLDEIQNAKNHINEHMRTMLLRTARLEYHMRFALPMAAVLFAVLAVPLGVTRARSGKGASFALSIGVLLIYYLVYMIFRDQAVRGRLSVPLGVWSANLVILPWCLYGIWKLRKPQRDTRGLWSWVKALYYRTARLLARTVPKRSEARKQASYISSTEGRDLDLDSLGGTSSRFIGRVDTHIGVQFLKTTAFALMTTYFIFFIVEFKQLFSATIENSQPLSVLLNYFKYFAPGMIPFTLPISCLVGGIVTITILNRTGELTAIKAGGISIRRATVPILFLTLVCCGLFYIVQDQIAPTTNRIKEEIKDKIMGRSPRTYGAHAGGRWVFGSDGSTLYHFRIYDENNEEFQALDVFTVDRKEMKLRDHWFASSAAWTGDGWTLRDAWYRTFEGEGVVGVNHLVEEEHVESLDSPEHFVQREMVLSSGTRMSEQMSLMELRSEISNLKTSGYDTTRLEVSYYGKFSWPAAPLVMVLLGLPFAFRVGRRGSLYGLGVAIILVIVYWATFAIFNAMGLETILPPFLAAWAPNILYGFLGTYMLLYVRT